jgi:hypothetical protein
MMENVRAADHCSSEDKQQLLPQHADSEPILEISVLTLSGTCHSIQPVASCSIGVLKQQLTSKVEAAPHQQRLLLGSNVLNDTAILSEVLPKDQTHHELLLIVCHDAGKADMITDMIGGRLRLSRVEPKYQEDYDVVLAAVRFDGMQLGDAHGAPRKDRTVIEAAIARNGFALTYAPAEFRRDRAVVLMGVKSNAFAFTLAAEELQKDLEFSAEAVDANPFVEKYLKQDDPNFQPARREGRFKKKPTCEAKAEPHVEERLPQAITCTIVAEEQKLNRSADSDSGRRASCCRTTFSRIGRLAMGCKALKMKYYH